MEISTLKHPQGFHMERRGNIHIKIPPNFPEFLRGNHEEIFTGMIRCNSSINPRQNLGDVDGLPAGNIRVSMGSLGLSASSVLSHDLSYVSSFLVMFSMLRSEVDELITNSVNGSTLAVYEHNRQFCRDMGMEATGRQCGESMELYMAHLLSELNLFWPKYANGNYKPTFNEIVY